MRALVLLLLLCGCLSGPKDVIPETWPETPDIHPGMRLFFDYGDTFSQCTAGFMFASPDNETIYLSVSAHCLHADGALEPGDPVYASPPGKGRAIGTIAFDGWAGGQTLQRDFALIALSNQEGIREKAHPAVAFWEGPLGLADSQTAVPGTKVVAYGNSMNREDASDNDVEGRMVLSLDGTLRVRLDRTAIGGDSGGPLLTYDGQALGILHGGEVYRLLLLEPELDVFTPLDQAIALLRAEGAADVRDARLVTWSTWNGPGSPVASGLPSSALPSSP